MRNFDPNWLSILSDLFVNLSAGWFGAAFIVPLTEPKPRLKFWVLTTNLLFGILFLVVAFHLRKLGGI